MDIVEIQHAWQHQPPRTTKGDTQMIADTIAAARQLDRRIRIRDLMEIAAAAGVGGAFVWIGRQAPVAWPWIVAALIVFGVAAIFIRERWIAARRHAVNEDMRTALTAALTEADRQVALLSSVVRWYLAPLSVAVGFMMLGMALGMRAEIGHDTFARALPIVVPATALALAVVAVVFAFVARLNRRAVAAHLAPHRDRLSAALADLDRA